MMNQNDIYYQAVKSRDPRFDGLFFIGVNTTGIYCRPICPAQPKRKNMNFYDSAEAAEAQGYRPCLRCRPESAPQSAAWLGTSAIVRRALNIIHQGQFDEKNETDFASRFGLSARHLRRLFQEELGQTPKQIMDRQRLNFARQLIIESTLPITQIAYLSGFGSVRRFNDSIKKRFTRNPSELRKKLSHKKTSKQEATVYLSYRPPFHWPSVLRPFKNHEMDGIESITDTEYARLIELNGEVAYLQVQNDSAKHRLIVTVSGSKLDNLYSVIQKVRGMFDLDCNPLLIEDMMQKPKKLQELYEKYPGLRIPKGWDAFEIAISTILGQLVSIQRGNQLCAQLIKHYGRSVQHPLTGENVQLFPRAENILAASLDEVGTTRMRKQALNNFCKAYINEEISLSPYQDYESFISNCISIKGIGPWTAEYVALRALGLTDAFPKEDLIIKRVLEKHKSIKADKFKPWRSYLTMYLWKLNEEQAGNQ